ncbi:MAG: hypothetical protein D6781_04845, partial [Verrucomicrobia bacterium]
HSGLSASPQDAAQTLQERVETALQLYRDQSAAIAAEKVPLLQEIGALEDENFALREQVNEALRLTSENNKTFEALQNELEALRSDTEFAERFLREYLDGFESRIHIAEDQACKEALTEIRRSLDEASPALVDRTGLYLRALEIGLERAEKLPGGYTFEGAAITPQGALIPGRIAVIGPAAYFTGAAGGDPMAGVLQFHAGTVEPGIQPLDTASAAHVAAFLAGTASSLPLDASLGSAIALEGANIDVADHIRRGGFVGYIILGLGAIALIVSLVKIIDISRFRTIESKALSAIIREAFARRESAALEKARKVAGPVGEMLELGIRNIGANSVLLEELMLSVILRRRPQVERYLPFLAITAAAAPLLGLLGTVVGMIRTFALITVFGTGDPRALSAGISEALVTTELGLMVAIPTLVLHGIFTRMIRAKFSDMERVAFEFVKTVALEESKRSPTAGNDA